MAWQLTGSAFEGLLTSLSGDRDEAALAYEQLRRRTIGLLSWWGAPDVDHLADQVFDRVARKLQEGAVVPDASLGAYVRGVARMVYYESTRQAQAVVPAAEPIAPDAADSAEASHVCLDRCLATVARDDRELVLRYYGAGQRAEVRRRLAEDLGISAATLRVRSHRLRERLERCVTACLAGQ